MLKRSLKVSVYHLVGLLKMASLSGSSRAKGCKLLACVNCGGPLSVETVCECLTECSSPGRYPCSAPEPLDL